MREKCAVMNCPSIINTHKSLKSYPFPKNPELREKWIEICGGGEFTFIPSATTKICILHFKESDFKVQYQLKKLPIEQCQLQEAALPKIVPQIIKTEINVDIENLDNSCNSEESVKIENTNELSNDEYNSTNPSYPVECLCKCRCMKCTVPTSRNQNEASTQYDLDDYSPITNEERDIKSSQFNIDDYKIGNLFNDSIPEFKPNVAIVNSDKFGDNAGLENDNVIPNAGLENDNVIAKAFGSQEYFDSSSESEILDDKMYEMPDKPSYSIECIKVENGFKCLKCDKVLISRGAFNRHSTRHFEYTSLCYICGQIVQTHRLIFYHERMHILKAVKKEPKIVDSPITDIEVIETVQLAGYKWKIGKTDKCPFCEKQFNSKIKYYDHINMHLKLKPYICSCGVKVGYYESFLTHTRKNNCQIEGRKLPDYAPQRALLSNVRVTKKFVKQVNVDCPDSTNIDNSTTDSTVTVARKRKKCYDYKCDECDINFANRVKLRQHLERVHMERKYICTVCNRKFAKENLLRIHVDLAHLQKRRCLICSKIVSYKNYKYHTQSHKRTDPDNLLKKKNHRQTKKDFNCRICNGIVLIKNIKDHYLQQSHLKEETMWRIKYKIDGYSCNKCHNVVYDRFLDFVHHKVYVHKFSMLNRGHLLFDLLESRK